MKLKNVLHAALKSFFRVMRPLAIIMAICGIVMAGVGFFGGEPGGETGRSIVEHRWDFVVYWVVFGFALLAADMFFNGEDWLRAPNK